MCNEKIFERVKKVISKTFNINIETITLENTLFLGQDWNATAKTVPDCGSVLDFSHFPYPENSFNMGVFDGFKLVSELEEEFDIEIQDTEVNGEKAMSVKDVVEFIALRIK